MKKYLLIGVCIASYLLVMSSCNSRNGCPGKITYKATTEKVETPA